MARFLRQFRVGGGELLLEFDQGTVLEFGGLVEVVGALGLLDLVADLLDLALEFPQFLAGAALDLPAGLQFVMARAQFGKLLFELLESLFGGRVGFALER